MLNPTVELGRSHSEAAKAVNTLLGLLDPKDDGTMMLETSVYMKH
jgi:hypothetical protein